jgi:PIN domain nuclease of toxin-antitoxin system
VRLLLDTAVLIYAVESPERLSRRGAAALRNTQNVSAVSVRQAVRDLDIRILPYTAEHAFQLFALSRHHGDPFDRQIIAQALFEKIPVITPDEKFGLYEGLKVVW